MNNATTIVASCLLTCQDQCSCPLGANDLICSGHGTCAEAQCICEPDWIRPTCDTKVFQFNGLTYGIVIGLASLCIFMALLTSVLYVVYRHDLTYGRPKFGMLMNVGVILGSIAFIYSAAIYPEHHNDIPIVEQQHQCLIVWILLDMSFMIVFGTLMAKTWRNVRILTTRKRSIPQALYLSDTWVVRVILSMVLIESLVWTVLVVVDNALFLEAQSSKTDHDNNGIHEHFEGCVFYSTAAFLTIASSKVSILIAQFVFAYQLRKTTTEWNESHSIFLSTGCTMFIWAFAFLVYVVSDAKYYGDVFYLALACAVLAPYVILMSTLCLHKVYTIHNTRSSSRMLSTLKPHNTEEEEDNDALERQSDAASIEDENHFLRQVVDWSDVAQVEVAEERLAQLKSLRLHHDVVLLLLSKKVRHRKIRHYAVRNILQHWSPSLVLLFLPQFIQALQYEIRMPTVKPDDVVVTIAATELLAQSSDEDKDENEDPEIPNLSTLLLQYAVTDWTFAHQLYWYIQVELENQEITIETIHGVPSRRKHIKKSHGVYAAFYHALQETLESTQPHFWPQLQQQQQVLDSIRSLYQDSVLDRAHEDVDTKTKHLQLACSRPEYQDHENTSGAHFIHPFLKIRGIEASKCMVFKSNAKPIKLQFQVDYEAQKRHVSQSIESSLQPPPPPPHSAPAPVRVLTIQIHSLDMLKNTTHDHDDYSWYYIRMDCQGHVQQTPLAQFDQCSNTWNACLEFEMRGSRGTEVELYCYGRKSSDFHKRHDTCLGHYVMKNADMFSTPQKCLLISSTRRRTSLVREEEYNLTLQTFKGEKRSPEHHVSDKSDIQKEQDHTMHDHVLQRQLSKWHPGVIYKRGDDLRQDHFALQFIHIIDRLLRLHDDLDLKFTLYSILPTSLTEGFAEFVEHAVPLAQVLRTYHHHQPKHHHTCAVQSFLRQYHFDLSSKETFEIDPAVFDTYLRSVAGYVVVTYVLGVGDRHLDNLMMRRTGAFFHIDFGYLFGHDPKPFAPAFRLPSDLVEAMGGLKHEHFQETFMNYATRAFLIVRQHAPELIMTIKAMTCAGLPDMYMPEQAQRALDGFVERLVLQASETQARTFLQGMIRHSQDSTTTTTLTVMEQFHKFALSRK